MPPLPTVVEPPEGLLYRPDFLSETEERRLLSAIEEIDFVEVSMRGQTARRTVRHYGYDYDYESWRLTRTEPLPSSVTWLRDRCADFAGVEREELAQTLVSRYPAGATIGWDGTARPRCSAPKW